MRLLLSGYFGVANYGDDILLRTIYTSLREVLPSAQIGVTIRRPTNYMHLLLDKSIIEVRRQDEAKKWPLVIYAGGGQFFDYKRRSMRGAILQLCLRSIGIKKLLRVFEVLTRARRLPVCHGYSEGTTAGIGLGVGPFIWGSAAEVETAKKLSSCQFLHVRDAMSLRRIHRWGLSVTSHQLVDLAFAERFWLRGHQSADNNTPRRGVGIVLGHSGYQGKEDWKDGLKTAIDLLRLKGLDVELISFCEEEDETAVAAIASGENVLRYNPSRTTLEEFTDRLSCYQVLVSGRAHGVIVAALRGIPCISIVKEEKLDWASRIAGGLCSRWRAPFDARQLVSMVYKALHTNDECKLNGLHGVYTMTMMAQCVLREFQDWIVAFSEQCGREA